MKIMPVPPTFNAHLVAGALVVLFAATLAVSQDSQTNQIFFKVGPNPAKVKQKITLTANVKTNGQPATGGTVTFFDGQLSLGSMQVVGTHPAQGHRTGTAVLTTILAPGSHQMTASYGGTAASPQRVRSLRVGISVTGKTTTSTLLQAAPNSGNPDNYDFTATVKAFGRYLPSGKVDFFDTTSMTDLGTAGFDLHHVSHGFDRPNVTPTLLGPAQSVVADFNGDGYPDLATANASFVTGTMSVFIGNGNGQFRQAGGDYPTGIFTSGIVAGDFNNDGIPDIAAMSQGSNGGDGVVDVLLGKGNGLFTSVNNDLGTFPVSIAVGDFDRDGILDVATVDYFTASADISIGNGDGTFKPPVPYAVGSGPFSVATTDFNNDGFLDLAVVNDDVDTLSVLLGNGDGTFQTQTVYPTGFQVEFVTTGDLDGDGSDDIAVANFGESTVGVYYNNGDGSFHDPVTFPVGGNDSGLAIGDVNGDGRPDIVASYFHPSKVGVLKNTGTSFSPVVDFGTGQTQGFELTLADLNGDGTPDVVSDDIIASFSVLLNVTAAVAKVTNVAVPGSKNDTAAVVATYSGDQRYKSSQSQPVKVHGSGAK